jgi:hypothetical protein
MGDAATVCADRDSTESIAMIDRTSLQIQRLDEHHEREREQRYARRNRLRYIDDLLDRFEALNLADIADAPSALTGRVARLATEQEHPLARRPHRGVPIAEWMDALYELQERLLPTEDDPD